MHPLTRRPLVSRPMTRSSTSPDGSVDNTAEAVARYPGVRYLRRNNQGLAAARNAGLEAAVGDYVVFLDADDRLLPAALETGLREFARHPECMFVAGSHRMIGFD